MESRKIAGSKLEGMWPRSTVRQYDLAETALELRVVRGCAKGSEEACTCDSWHTLVGAAYLVIRWLVHSDTRWSPEQISRRIGRIKMVRDTEGVFVFEKKTNRGGGTWPAVLLESASALER